MHLQTIITDPNIANFLQEIPQDQHIITLKQLIYIGIKIVSNSLTESQNIQGKHLRKISLSEIQNKENKKINTNAAGQRKKYQMENFNQTKYKTKELNKHKELNKPRLLNKPKEQNFPTVYSKGDKIQSTLLREISKIRVHLQSLTNKVYDHYFDQKNQNQQGNQSFELNNRQNNIRIHSQGFQNGENIPTFSPKKGNNFLNQAQNPFLKQKNNFFVTQTHKNYQPEVSRNWSLQNRCPIHPDFEQRNRSRSNILHLDDTQIRQALYKDENELSHKKQIDQKDRSKKSRSMIQKRHQQKKKDQQNYFYRLALDKQNIKELQIYRQLKPVQNSSYRDFVQQRSIKIDPYKVKAKSKIKKLVQRDKLKHKEKIYEQNFQKGFQQYQYSANQLDEQNQIAQSPQGRDQQYEQQFQSSRNQKESGLKQQRNGQQSQEKRSSHKSNNFGFDSSHLKQQRHGQQSQEKRSSQKSNNFGFYSSQQQRSLQGLNENTFSNNQNTQNQENQASDRKDSNFSEFSEFSISSGSSRRQAGKISRKNAY